MELLPSVSLLENVDLFPESICEAYKAIPDDIKHMTEEQIKTHQNITTTDELLRNSFWNELLISQRSGKRVMAKRIFLQITSETHFFRIIKNPYRMAYISLPVISYEVRVDALLNRALGRYEELLDMDITTQKKVVKLDENGKPVLDDRKKEVVEYIKVIDPARAKILLETIKNLEDRAKGSAVQRIQRESVDQSQDINNMDNIDQRIAELESQLVHNPKMVVQDMDGETVAEIE